MGEFSHKPVMPDECIDALNIKPDGIYVDGTLGGGGHSERIAERLTSGKLICIDRDEDAISAASARLEKYKDKIVFVHDNFANVKNILENLSVPGIDGIMKTNGPVRRSESNA